MVIKWIRGKNAKGKLRKVRYINMEENLEKWASELFGLVRLFGLLFVICYHSGDGGRIAPIVMEAMKLETD